MAGWNADTAAGPLGIGTVTLVQGSSFCISQPSGDIHPDLPHGVFFQDTRILSNWQLTINGEPIESLIAETKAPYRALFAGRVPRPDGYADSPLLVERLRDLGAGIRESIKIRNFSLKPVQCTVRMTVDADFADLFEVKEARVQRHWEQTRNAHDGSLEISAGWQGLRKSIVIDAGDASASIEGLIWEVAVPAKGLWCAQLSVAPTVDGSLTAAPFVRPMQGEASQRDMRHQEWVAKIPVVRIGNRSIERTLRRSFEDLGALRIEDSKHPERVVVAAGAPWFMTLFGRDSLWASEMALPVDPSLALGTLQTLADLQGIKVDPLSEEEPGKILHEVRPGVAGELSLGSKKAYYGSVDATPLFVNVLGAVNRWGFAKETIAALLPHADRALDWIRDYGDKDEDGFVEYKRLNDQGLVNQGWKDSWDGINFANGALAEPPLALCEVQAYVYSAYMSRAWMAYDGGDRALAIELEERAASLKQRFNDQFWLPKKGYYAVALDKDKQPVDACTSNMGQCLWYGIVDEDRVPRVVERLMSAEMFSGWGVRTLASDMGAYNPASYHNGSVWPHDNAVIVAGLIRYGYVSEAQQIATALLEAADHSDGRLPELFCGFDRHEFERPVPYPTACSPQAWAAATPIFLLTSLLRYDVYVPQGGLWLDPVLPESFGNLHIDKAPTGAGPVTIDAAGTSASVRGLPKGMVHRRGHRLWMTELMAQAHLHPENQGKNPWDIAESGG